MTPRLPEEVIGRDEIRRAHIERQLIAWSIREGEAQYRFALAICKGAQCRLDKRLTDLEVMGVTA